MRTTEITQKAEVHPFHAAGTLYFIPALAGPLGSIREQLQWPDPGEVLNPTGGCNPKNTLGKMNIY